MSEDTKSTIAFVTIAVLIIGTVLFFVIRSSNNIAAATKTYVTWKHKCIDAGGTPVTILDYVKGVGDGERCIKSVEVIDLK